MASCIVHIAISEEIYKRINNKNIINHYEYILGSIAPDISRVLNQDKRRSHFFKEDNLPNINSFLKKYKTTLNKSFNLGYYIHLYTDLLFYRDFLPLFIKEDLLYTDITCLDKSKLKLSIEDTRDILYNDYSNLNIQVINEYNLDLDLFYTEYKIPDTNIDEIDIKKLNILIDKMGTIIETSKEDKQYIINISSIKSFIDNTVEEIYNNLLELNIIN